MNRAYLKNFKGKNFPTQTSRIGAEMGKFGKGRPKRQPKRPDTPALPAPGSYLV